MAAGLRFPIVADDRASKKLLSVGKVAGRVATGIGLSFVAAGAVAAGALFKIGKSVDSMRSEIVKGTGASGQALDGLLDSATRVSAKITQGMDGAGVAIATLNTHFGVTDEKLEKISKRTADFARVTNGDIGAMADSLGQIGTIWGLSSDQASKSLDTMTGVVQGFNIDGTKLLTMLQRFGPLFANAGASVEQTAVLFGELHHAGVDVTRVGPGINAFLRKVAAEGGDAGEALADISDKVANAATDMEALNIAQTAFGAEGAQRLTSAIRAGGVSFNFAADDVASYSGALEQASKDSLTLNDKLSLVKNEITATFAPVAFELLTDVTDWVTKIVDDIKNSTAAQDIKKAMEEGDWLGAAGKALKLAWDVIWDGDVDADKKGIIPDVETKIQALKTAVETEGPKLWSSLNYLEGFQGSEAQLALARAWEAFQNDPIAAWNSVKCKFLEWEPWIRKNFPNISKAIDDFTDGKWDQSLENLVQKARDATGTDDEKDKGGLKGALRKLRNALEEDMPLLAGAVNLFADDEEWKMPWRNFAGKMAISFTEGGQLAFNSMIGAINVGLEGLLTVAVSGTNGLIKILNGAIRGINIINPFEDIPYIPEIDRDTLEVPDIPKMNILENFHKAIEAWMNYDIGGIREGEIENRAVAGVLSDIVPTAAEQGQSSYEQAKIYQTRADELKNRATAKALSDIIVESPDQVSRYADGGLVARPTLGLVGEEGPELIVPLDRAGQSGMGKVEIHFHAPVFGKDAADMILDALRQDERLNGRLPLVSV